ncbi:acyltransferase family protein [Virgibacillus doumboii]|uniref:acyltransferase family protein n=1 Tax=Virgibacillus doumboii TaxID=2697503 RepID=UPI0013DE96D7|nr:acyltransferase [Virgibacillus doumboii]
MERNSTIDVMKCIAVFLVVSLHTVTYGYDWQEVEYIRFIIRVFPRWVIPFFFIAAGYFFARKIKQHNSRAYFNQYVTKLIRLFIIWYLFYLIYDLAIQVVLAVYMGLNVKAELLDYITSYVNVNDLYYGSGMTSYHLWFLTALIWSMVILYVALRFNKLKFLLIVSCVLNIIGLFGQTYSSIFSLPIHTRDALFFGLFYTTIGCYIAMHRDWIIKKISGIKSSIFVYLFLLLSLIQIGEWFLTVKILDGTKMFGDYYATTAPLTISLFLITLKNISTGRNTFIAKVGKNAVGIYVSHLFVISIIILLFKLLDISYLRNNFWFNLMLVLTIFFISYYFFIFFNSLLNKIKILFLSFIGDRKHLRQSNKTAM